MTLAPATLDLAPALLITGHGEPIEGEETVRVYLTRLRDATRYIRDETVKGMNAGKTLDEIMQIVRLPAVSLYNYLYQPFRDHPHGVPPRATRPAPRPFDRSAP